MTEQTKPKYNPLNELSNYRIEGLTLVDILAIIRGRGLVTYVARTYPNGHKGIEEIAVSVHPEKGVTEHHRWSYQHAYMSGAAIYHEFKREFTNPENQSITERYLPPHENRELYEVATPEEDYLAKCIKNVMWVLIRHGTEVLTKHDSFHRTIKVRNKKLRRDAK